MNMYPSKKNNGWILCPSKSFPGKFYYFNVATGETAWGLNETERKSLKNPPLQGEDHCFPEPSSPPAEETRTKPLPQPPANFNSYNERISYPQDMYQNLPNNLGYAVQPYYDQTSNSVPYQIQLPTVWPQDTNMPQVIMIVMNQAMRQLSIAEPKQGYRQQNYALQPNQVLELNRPWYQPNQVLEINRPWYQPNQVLEPNRAWKEPNQVLEPNRAWKDANQAPEPNRPRNEPNRSWEEPYQAPEPNRVEKESSQDSQQASVEPKELDRELFIHSGKAPLCKRFINFKKPVLEFKDNKVVRPNQYDLATNKSNLQTSHNHSKDSPGPSKLDHETNNQQEHKFRGTIFDIAKEKDQCSNAYFNFAKKGPEKVETNANIMPSTSGSVSSPKNFSNLSQNTSKTNQGYLKQTQTTKTLFGQSQTTKHLFGQSISNKEVFNKQGQTKHELFEQSQRNPELFEQSQTNKELFTLGQTKHDSFDQTQRTHVVQSQTNKELFGQSQTNPDHLWPSKNFFGQSHTNKERFGQSQIKQQLFRPSQTCPKIFQSYSLESNPFQKLIAEKSTLKQSAKVDFPISPKPNLEVPSYYENVNSANAKQKTALILDKKAEISKEDPSLDKNDLRRILLEKKRKSIGTSDSIEAKKIKTSMKQNPEVSAPKKKVTFNLDPERFSDYEHEDTSYKEMECQEDTPMASERWYVVTDAKTLLEDFNVLDGFVKSDPKCNLMIPSGVMSDIVALSRSECRERNLVTLARRVLRGLATPQPHIILQQSEDVSLDISTDDSILNCCLEVMDNAYTVLITNDEHLQTTAAYLSINCFTSEQIKNGQAKQSKVHFDVENVNISIANKPEPMDIPIKKFENLSFGTEDWTHQNRSSPDCVENAFNSYTKAGEPELNHTANDFENPKRNSHTFEIQKELRKFNTTTLKKSSSLPYSNETTSPWVQNNGKKIDVHLENQHQNASYQKETNKEDTLSTTFRQAKEKIKSKSISKGGQPRSPNLKSNWPPTQMQKQTNAIFATEKDENHNITLSKPLFFGEENNTNSRNKTRQFVLEMDTKDNPPKTVPGKEKNVTDIKNRYLEQFLKRFCEKNKTIERLVEERKIEIGCSFTQIMEECLNDILKDKSTLIEEIHKTTPLWTFSEALECMVTVYSNHTYIRDVVAVFTSVLNADGNVPARDVIRTLGCGMALVKYLMFIQPTTDILKDTEEALDTLLRNVTVDVDIQPTAPALSSAAVGCVKSNKRNFVKDRSYVVKYLKKHFAAWADYDETLEENTSKANWGKNYKDTMIVRTSGKNLGMLKLNNLKAMTMEPDSSQNVDENEETNQNVLENLQRNVNIGNETETENMDVDNIISNDKFGKDHFDLKLTRIVKNTTAKMLKGNADSQKLTPTQENQSKPQQTEPKVIRLCGNIDFTKEKTKKVPEKLIFDNFSTHGHTFGRTDQNGPKVSINVKPIKEFEERLKIEQKHLELDEMDYSVISKSDENNNLASESTNNNCLSMSIENNAESTQKRYIDAKNDRLYGQNDSLNAINDSQNRNHIGNATFNESQSKSHEKCINNNNYRTIDLDEISPTNYINKSNDIFDSNFNNYGKNDNYDVDAMSDDFKKLNRISFEMNDMMVQKDDMTNDSGYENASIQAYYLMDTFLFELKVAFKLMHQFLGSCVRELRSGQLSISNRHIICDTATMANAHLNKIMENLDGIIRRETSSGPKLKELVAGAGSLRACDERVDHYREIVTKCYVHSRLVEKALKAVLSVTDDRRL